jgi:hypothetical protein
MRLDTEELKARINDEINRVKIEKANLQKKITQLDLRLARFLESAEALEGVERTAARLGLFDLEEFVADSNGDRLHHRPAAGSERSVRMETVTDATRPGSAKDMPQRPSKLTAQRSVLPSDPENLDISALEEVLEATRPDFSDLTEVEDLREAALAKAKEKLQDR